MCEKTGEVWKPRSCEEPFCHLVSILSLHAEKVCLKPNMCQEAEVSAVINI